jgi:hypothetical protein
MDGKKRTTEFQISSLQVMIESEFYEERRRAIPPQTHKIILNQLNQKCNKYFC